jgi:hypothetical protein
MPFHVRNANNGRVAHSSAQRGAILESASAAAGRIRQSNLRPA